jgi:hypothetical protein
MPKKSPAETFTSLVKSLGPGLGSEHARALANNLWMAEHPGWSFIVSPILPALAGGSILGGSALAVAGHNAKKRQKEEEKKVDALMKLWLDSGASKKSKGTALADYQSKDLPKQVFASEDTTEISEEDKSVAIFTLLDKLAAQDDMEANVDEIPIEVSVSKHTLNKQASASDGADEVLDPIEQDLYYSIFSKY